MASKSLESGLMETCFVCVVGAVVGSVEGAGSGVASDNPIGVLRANIGRFWTMGRGGESDVFVSFGLVTSMVFGSDL